MSAQSRHEPVTLRPVACHQGTWGAPGGGCSKPRRRPRTIRGDRADRMSRPLLWDVDTQVDFVHAGAKLPVPDAEAAIPAMARLVRWAEDRDVTHLATADDHELTDPELSDEPDYVSTFPPHCLRGTHGAAKIAETLQRDPLPLSLTPYPPGHIPKLVEGRRELLVLKKTYSAFSNPNLEPLLADPRPVGGDPLRRCHGRLQPRGRPGPARTRDTASPSSRTPRAVSRRSASRRVSRSGARAASGSRRATRWSRRPRSAAPRRARPRGGRTARLREELARRGRAPAARPRRRGAGSSGSPRSAPAPGWARRGSQPLCVPGTPLYTAEADRCACRGRGASLRRRSRRPRASRATGALVLPPHAPFDLIFVDGGRAKDDPDAVLGLAAPGATLVLDDFSADWRGPDPRRERWLTHPRVTTIELGTGGNATTIVGVVRR